jgi:hypothetical protein
MNDLRLALRGLVKNKRFCAIAFPPRRPASVEPVEALREE